MSRKLVACFSASGTTARTAKALAKAAGADYYEIKPAVAYTRADLDWMNKKSRSSIEMGDDSSRPELADRNARIEDYDVIFLGFPIWWYRAPTIINTFLEQYDWAGKVIIPFATSGGSGMGGTNSKLAPSCPGADLRPGKLLNGGDRAVNAWLKDLKI